MTTIVTRAGKGSPLTWNEVDTNFTNLNSAKYESGNNVTLGTIGGTTISGTSFSSSGNLTFTGTGNRITGDFSNATPSSRALFQTSTVNGVTRLGAIPNGTASQSNISAYNSSDPSNSSFTEILTLASESRIQSNVAGTGTFLPMTFHTGGSERMRIDTSGRLGIGTSSPLTNTLLTLQFDNGTLNTALIATAYGVAPTINTRNAGGTAASPTASSSSPLNIVAATTSDGTTFFNTIGIAGTIESTPTTGSHPTALAFSTTPSGSTTRAERMRIDSAGNVGIGTSSPAVKLDVAGFARFGNYGGTFQGIALINNNDSASAETASYIDIQNNLAITDSSMLFRHQTDGGSNISFITTPPGSRSSDRRAERMRITSAGNVGIGTSSPAVKLDVNGGIRTQGWGGFPNAGNILFGNAVSAAQIYGDNNVLAFYSSNSGSAAIERMRIDSSGNLLVGSSTSPGGTGGFLCPNQIFLGGRSSVVSGTSSVINMNYNGGTIFGIMMQNISATTGNALTFINSSLASVGSISTSSSATAYNTTSDYRLKENILPITGALDVVAQLKPVTYNWKADGSDGQGFIAHELQEVVPDAVTGEKDAVDADGNPQYQGIDTSFLVATLTAAIQELSAKVDTLQAELNTLKGN